MGRKAIVLMSMGGPDSLDAVLPFLRNLFDDPHIIPAPWPIRKILSWYIARKRTPFAQENYRVLGGKSPLLEQSLAQATELQKHFNPDETKIFVCMRYWHPFSRDVAKEVEKFVPDEVILLPLYPQYSTATTLSCFEDWEENCQIKNRKICCYPTNSGFIAAVSRLLSKALTEKSRPVVLFSAHGLPIDMVKAGDPYQFQIEQTVAAVVKNFPDLNYRICYQSRVGPKEWLKPYTDEEIIKEAKAGNDIIVVPIAFVSEHSETLYELDIEYGKLAEENNARSYTRVRTVETSPEFIKGLADLVNSAKCEKICSSFKKCYQC